MSSVLYSCGINYNYCSFSTSYMFGLNSYKSSPVNCLSCPEPCEIFGRFVWLITSYYRILINVDLKYRTAKLRLLSLKVLMISLPNNIIKATILKFLYLCFHTYRCFVLSVIKSVIGFFIYATNRSTFSWETSNVSYFRNTFYNVSVGLD